MADFESSKRSTSRYRAGTPTPSDICQAAAWDAIGHEVDLYSERELQQALFDELALPPTPDLVTDTASLRALDRVATHPFLTHLLAYRDARAAVGDLG
ncbi:hypothetical protein ACWIGI_37685 [Nocardia sp. NPDC055321]